VNVHQILSGAGPHDAITSEALAFRERFSRWGWGGGDHAGQIVPGLNGAFSGITELRSRPDDVLLLHHSAWTPRLEQLLTLPGRKLLLYHNITPAGWLWERSPILAAQCHVGRQQLQTLVRAVDAVAADSQFNAEELAAFGANQARVIPLLLKLDRLGPPSAPPPGPPHLLFVGRLSPHKRQDEVIRTFALYRRHRSPDARLTLVGDPITGSYGDWLRDFADEQAPGAVTIESGLSSAELGERYRSAHAFLCLSEHEGFCIPLIEALHFGIPVIARPAGAIPQTAGDAAVLVGDEDLAVVAELVHLAITDHRLRSELARRGRKRVEAYAPERVEEELRAAVLQAAAR
jgi:glycosyltransferase involved in cell wall biosynthesis